MRARLRRPFAGKAHLDPPPATNAIGTVIEERDNRRRLTRCESLPGTVNREKGQAHKPNTNTRKLPFLRVFPRVEDIGVATFKRPA
jgi:hypothetical protein